MSYEIAELLCGDDRSELEYIGDGDYVCPLCGTVYHDNDYDEDFDGESLSADDAADIWGSRGMDEDYTFGYSEDELKSNL